MSGIRTTELKASAQRDETAGLISSEKVEGTAVYDPTGTWLGSIQSVMINKVSGRVAYAVMSFGGFLGLGQRFFPVPWSKLRYEPGKEGYVTSITEGQISAAPAYDAQRWDDAEWRDGLDRYYGVAIEPDLTRTGGSI
jgi:sporulation protein YlmC with PRC-barrel domain